MQTRNLLLFMLCTTLTMLGWVYFSAHMWPPQPKPPPPPVIAPPPPAPWPRKSAEAVADLVLAGAAPDPVRLAFQSVAVAAIKPPAIKIEPVKPVKKIEPAERPEPIALGGDDYKIRATLTTLGAGVETVTLTQFQAADQWGKPAVGTDGQPVPLTLVPGHGLPSHLIYHYEKPDDARPVDTLGKLVWKVKRGADKKPLVQTTDSGDQTVVFEAELTEPAVRVTKTFTLRRGDYHIGLKVRVERTGSGPAPKFKYQLTGAHGLPIEGGWYTYTYRNALIGWEDRKAGGWRELEDSRQISLWRGGDLQARGDKTIVYGGVAIQYFASVVAVDDEQEKRDFVERVRSTLEQAVLKGKIEAVGDNTFELLAADKKKYTFKLAPGDPVVRAKFMDLKNTHALSEARKKELAIAVVWTMEGDDFVATDILNEENTNPLFYDDVTVRLISDPLELKSKEAVEHKYVLYNGPVKVRLLGQLEGDKEVDPALVERYEHALHLNTLTDYHSPGFMGNISSFIGLNYLVIKFTNLMHWLLWHLHGLIENWGLCIIALTVIVRGIMFPISRRQTNNQVAMQEKMARLAPEVKKLEERFKGDYMALNQAKHELYLRHGVNQLSMLGGCVLVFAQMPIFLGLYYALQESIHFRLQDFLWIQNLAAPDMLIEWGTGIPMISTAAAQVSSPVYLGPFFNLLPVVAVTLMIVQQKMLTPPPTDEQQEMQQKMMKWMMVVMGFMFYKVAAGLCIYFTASSLWGLAERKLFPKRAPAGAGGGPTDVPEPTTTTRPRPDTVNGRPREEPEVNGWRQKLRDWWQDMLKEAGKQQQARSDKKPDKRDDEPGPNRGKKKKRR